MNSSVIVNKLCKLGHHALRWEEGPIQQNKRTFLQALAGNAPYTFVDIKRCRYCGYVEQEKRSDWF